MSCNTIELSAAKNMYAAGVPEYEEASTAQEDELVILGLKSFRVIHACRFIQHKLSYDDNSMTGVNQPRGPAGPPSRVGLGNSVKLVIAQHSQDSPMAA